MLKLFILPSLYVYVIIPLIHSIYVFAIIMLSKYFKCLIKNLFPKNTYKLKLTNQTDNYCIV